MSDKFKVDIQINKKKLKKPLYGIFIVDNEDETTKCNEINNIVNINLKKNKIFFISEGDYASLVVEKNVCLDQDINISLNFNTKKLLNICKLYKLYTNLVVEFMEDTPLKIYFTDENSDIEITFFLVNEI